ncbi:hypothetical protein UA08_01706 [Talaromyces atroroseus]|uniref:Uncharacterized protein n=1 Tax=Talaromyces atroroseus TaxID=1441469 RepID=A0A1Q5QA53_TALAT|nr:hypothetical protein UA08_01706 [Talaromyces atroroseus]OKL62827.1 hypothetical protein UA08_01706 [Talaromyces atroroseus]
MAADEYNTMSATLRFPFQASLDGSSLVETNGDFYYGHGTAHVVAELPAETPPEEPVTEEAEQSEPEAEAATMADLDEEQQHYNQQPPAVYQTPRWDSLLNDQGPQVTTSRPVSLLPHRIDTSDQQRFATEHEMTAEQTEDEGLYCESPTSTIEPPAPSKVELLAQRGAPPRFYSTPIVDGDPSSTPVALYGLEQPSEHIVRSKKLVSPLRSRTYYSTAPIRPSSRHGPSPFSSTLRPGIPEAPEPLESSSKRISVMLRRASQHLTQSTYIPSRVDRPGVDSTGSSTNSTIRSMATTFAPGDEYTTPASSTAASPTLEATPPPDEKPSPSADTTDHHIQDNQPDVAVSSPPSLPPSPPRPIRRKTTSAMSYVSDSASVSGESSRRMSIFNLRFRKPSPMSQHSFTRSNETLSTIRAAGEDAQHANTFPLPPAAPTRSPSKPMPYSPDSFISPHGRTQYRTTPLPDDDTTTNNSIASPNPIRPHTSYIPATASSSNTTSRSIRNFSKPRNFESATQSQPSGHGHSEKSEKQKRTAAHRATKFLARVFISD